MLYYASIKRTFCLWTVISSSVPFFLLGAPAESWLLQVFIVLGQRKSRAFHLPTSFQMPSWNSAAASPTGACPWPFWGRAASHGTCVRSRRLQIRTSKAMADMSFQGVFHSKIL